MTIATTTCVHCSQAYMQIGTLIKGAHSGLCAWCSIREDALRAKVESLAGLIGEWVQEYADYIMASSDKQEVNMASRGVQRDLAAYLVERGSHG